MLLAILNKARPEKTQEENERSLQAERFIDNLPDNERKLVEDYIERFTNWLADEEPYLYRQGFLDGARVINLLGKL